MFLVRPLGLEPRTSGLTYQLLFSQPDCSVCGLDFLFTHSIICLGGSRQVSTRSHSGLRSGLPVKGSPNLTAFTSRVSPQVLLLKSLALAN